MRHTRTTSCVTPVLSLFLTAAAFAEGGPVFQSMGDLTGGAFSSKAFGISADGHVVVGASTAATGERTIRWTSGGGMSELPMLAAMTTSRANAVSADGAVIVGRCADRSVRWVGGAVIDLNTFSSGSYSAANGVSSDGQLIVGNAFNGSLSSPDTIPYRWTQATGTQHLGIGYVTGGIFEDFGAKCVSADGTVIVGNEGIVVREAFHWTAASGLVGLGYLPFGPQIPDSTATAVSGDSTVVVGQSVSLSGPQAFRWNSGDGMAGLGDLQGGDFNSMAHAASADGSVIVGRGTGAAGPEAFVWDSVHGMRSLRNILLALGAIELNNWVLTTATAVSADGLTIVGYGTNPAGDTEGWVARIPRAVVCYANCDGSTAGPTLGISDFSCFMARFEAGDTYANCDGSNLPPVLNVNDYLCFMNKIAVGCQ